jgi:hypothetical protein
MAQSSSGQKGVVRAARARQHICIRLAAARQFSKSYDHPPRRATGQAQGQMPVDSRATMIYTHGLNRGGNGGFL